MTTLETLKAARAKIADRKHWTHHAYARNHRSEVVDPKDTKACRWCAVGALRAVAPENLVDRADNRLAQFAYLGSVLVHNDERGYAATLEMFDKAIASLEVA